MKIVKLMTLILLLAFAGAARSQDAAALKAFDAVTTPSLAETRYINAVRAFIAENKNLPADQTNIVFIGDSVIEGFNAKEYFPHLPILNRGIGSDLTYSNLPGSFPRGILSRMDCTLYDTRPRAMFLLIGTNHMADDTTDLDKTMREFRQIIDLAQARFPKLKISLITVPHSGQAFAWANMKEFNERAVKFNRMIRDYAKEKSFPLIDLGSLLNDDKGLLREDFTIDGIHLTKPANDIWALETKEVLKCWGEPVN